MTSPQGVLEELISWATPESRKADLIEARTAHLSRTGEIFEDDRQVVQRMATFLEWYVCDRVAPWLQKTPARARYELALKTENAERARYFRNLTETIHSLFEVISLAPGRVHVRDVLSDVEFDVTERRQLIGLTRGDVIEARLIPLGREFHFSTTWCFHPHEAAEAIRLEGKRLRAGTAQRTSQALISDCAQRSLKADRYRQISVTRIYDFKNTTL